MSWGLLFWVLLGTFAILYFGWVVKRMTGFSVDWRHPFGQKTKEVPRKNKIEEYDRELLEDIWYIDRRISEEEKSAKDFMMAYDTDEDTIEAVAQARRNEGSPITGSLYFSSRDALRRRAFLVKMVPVYKKFPFRVWTRYVSFTIPPETNVFTEDSWLIFDTRPLDSEERAEYAKQWEATRVLNEMPIDIYHMAGRWYPNRKLMRFVANMLEKYGADTVLTKGQDNRDKDMERTLLGQWGNRRHR